MLTSLIVDRKISNQLSMFHYKNKWLREKYLTTTGVKKKSLRMS